ncbi:MAG TPA: hypothetical protein VGO47_00210, partial [Chlamydiales bacterium]|nr:hypothetical protein [Chlamydiales bacterium]
MIVDPSTALVRAQPKEERDLMVGARNNWLLAFDNLSLLFLSGFQMHSVEFRPVEDKPIANITRTAMSTYLM